MPLKKKPNQTRTCRVVDFAVQADYKVKLKENKKRNRYLDLAKELKKLWNLKLTIIQIVTHTLDTVIKELVQGLEDLENWDWSGY